MQDFIQWTQTRPEYQSIGAALSNAGSLDTGSQSGRAPGVWRSLAQDPASALLRAEREFVEERYWQTPLNILREDNPEIAAFVESNPAMSEVLFSTAVQHGPRNAARFFARQWRPEVAQNSQAALDYIDRIYARRTRDFPSSTPQVRQSVANRFQQEAEIARNAFIGTFSNNLTQPEAVARSPDVEEQFTTPAGLAVPLVTGLEAPQFPAPRRPRRPRRGAAEAAPNALAQGQESPGRQQPQSEPGRPRVRQALTNFFNRFFGDESAAQTGQLPSMANFQPSENPVPAGPAMQPAAPMEQAPMMTRPPYSSSVFAPVAAPARPTPSYAMGGFVGPGGQPIMPAGLSTRTAPPEVGMDVTPEQIDQTVNQTMQANPQMVQQVQQLIMESVQSGETTMEELNTLGQMAQAALQDPNLYPQLRQLAIREGLATQEDIPPQFDPALITVMLVAVRAVKDATAQQPPTPQPIQSMAMGGAVVPISKKQSIDPRHDEPVIAELEKGEYVIPKNVVEMKGREFFDSLIAKYDPANAKGAKS
jgi:hypothetical protein